MFQDDGWVEKVKAIFTKYGFTAVAVLLADFLPGLLGAIVSFVFRTTGQVIGFLGKHAWLWILAVAIAAFLIERVTKRD